jgi:hypothetical protein
VVVCSRRFSLGELARFTHLAMAPVAEGQLRDLAVSLGAGGARVDLPRQVADIGQWPLWATALLVHGPQVQTGLELLQALVEARLTGAGMSATTETAELRSAAGFLALELWTDIESAGERALQALVDWAVDPATQARFDRRPAEDVLGRLEEAGLVEVGGTVAFPHRRRSQRERWPPMTSSLHLSPHWWTTTAARTSSVDCSARGASSSSADTFGSQPPELERWTWREMRSGCLPRTGSGQRQARTSSLHTVIAGWHGDGRLSSRSRGSSRRTNIWLGGVDRTSP